VYLCYLHESLFIAAAAEVGVCVSSSHFVLVIFLFAQSVCGACANKLWQYLLKDISS
jgi:hypothetical protein